MANVFVVDDDPQIRTWLRHLLEAKGYSVEEFEDGDAVQASLQQNRPDLLVLDIYLPGKEGFEIILRLKLQAHPVKILAISGNVFEGFDTCATAKLLGADDALAKPFNAETFLKRVDGLLSYPSEDVC